MSSDGLSKLPPISFATTTTTSPDPAEKLSQQDERIQAVSKAQQAKGTVGRALRYLFLSEKRITIYDTSSANTVTVNKVKSLVSKVFEGELEVSEPIFSSLGKPSIAISYKKEQKNLSKTELARLTDKVVDELKEKILKLVKGGVATSGKSEEEKQLVDRLMVAEKLQIMLRDKEMGESSQLHEYLSVKQEAFLAIARTLCFPAFVVVQTGLWATHQWKRIRNVYRVDQLIKTMHGAETIADPEYWKRMREMATEAQKLTQFVVSDPQKFKDTYERLAGEPGGQEVLEKVFRLHHGLLKRALTGKDVGVMQMVIEKGLFKSATNTTLDLIYSNTSIAPPQREQLIRTLFEASRSFKSMGRVVDYLSAHNERVFAENLVREALELTQDEEGKEVASLSFPRSSALLLAAKLGGDELLKQAFGIEKKDTVETIASKMKAYVQLPQPQGRSLLSFAIEGGDPKFIIGVERAIYEQNSATEVGSSLTYREKKKEGLNQLLQNLNEISLLHEIGAQLVGQKLSRSKQDVIAAELPALLQMHPELSYLEEFKDQPTTFATQLYRELLNQEVSPFHARDAHGVEAISRLDLGAAAVLDELLATYMDPPTPVDCFSSAAHYTEEMRCPRGYFVAFMTSLGYLLGTVSFALTPPQLTFIGSTLLTTVGHQTPYGGMAGEALGETVKHSVWAKMLADRHHNKFLTQYIQRFPVDPTAEPKSVESDTPRSVKIRAMGPMESSITPSTDPKELQSQIEMHMERNDAKEVLNDLKAIQALPLDERKKVNWERIVSRYPDLTLYTQQERHDILALLFDLVETADQLLDIMDSQLTLGRRGAEMLTRYFEEMIPTWEHSTTFDTEEKQACVKRQYEAAMLAAAKVGSLDLYQKLEKIQWLKQSFNWAEAGGSRTSLLHASLASKWNGSNVQSAKLVHAIYKETLTHNKDPNFSPFDLVRGGSTWYNKWLMDKHIMEMQTLQQAAAFDAELGMDASTVGSMTHEVLKELQIAWMPAQVGNLMSMPVRSVLYKVAASLIIVLPQAMGVAFSFAGPVGTFLGRVTAILVLELSVIFAAFAANRILGKSLTRAYRMAIDEWKGHKPLSQLGETAPERLEILKRKEATHPDLEKLENEMVAEMRLEAVQTVKDQLILGVEELQTEWKYDTPMWNKLESLKQGIKAASSRRALKSLIVQADLSPTQRFVIVRRLTDLFLTNSRNEDAHS